MVDKTKLADKLRPASFRGVPFQVETTDLGAGRRTQLHEYPQRDKPYVEDLGRATRDLAFTGYVVGDDYVDQANKLLAALEEFGPGDLVHPWFGTLTVSLKDSARVSFDGALGLARFTMAFIESGELAFPSAESSTQSESRLAASDLESISVESFAEQFKIKGFQDFVAAAASGNLGDMLGIVSSSEVGKVLGYANSLATTISTAIALISNPSALGWKIMSALGLSGLATSVAAWSGIVRSISRVGSSSSLSAPATPLVYTPSRQQAYVNACAVAALGRQALIAQAVGASSLVGTRVDSPRAGLTQGIAVVGTASASAQPLISYTDMVAVRDELIGVIDQESFTASDKVYHALMKARAAVSGTT